MHAGFPCAGARQQTPDIGRAAFHAHPRQIATGLVRVDHDRLNDRAGRGRNQHGKQRRLERQQAAAIAATAFGEKGQARPGSKLGAHRGNLAAHAHPVGAVDEDGVVHPAQKIEPRPDGDAVLRHERRAGLPAQYQRVGPAKVVGNIEHIAADWLPDAAHPYAACARAPRHEKPRPGGGAAKLPAGDLQRHTQRRDGKKPDDACRHAPSAGGIGRHRPDTPSQRRAKPRHRGRHKTAGIGQRRRPKIG